MRIFSRISILFGLFLLTACDSAVQVDIGPDAMITTSQVNVFDERACAAVTALGVADICSETGGKATLNSETGMFEMVPPASPETVSIADFADKMGRDGFAITTHDETRQTVSIEVEVAQLQRLFSPTPPSAEYVTPQVGELGPLEAYEGRTFTLTLTAAEILETSGAISDDGKSATFVIPLSYLVYNIGEPGISTISVTARY